MYILFFFFFKQKTAYEMRISDWSSDVCSSDLQRNNKAQTMTRLVALDTETTGLKSKEGDRIVEIAMVEITRSANPRYFQSYFNPGDREVHPEAFAVHGLSNEFLKGAPTFEEKLPEIFDFLDGDR